MKIKITAGGIYNGKGEEIQIGEEFEVKSEPTGWAGRYTVLSGGDTKGKTAVVNPQQSEAGYAVKDKGGSWFVITKDGEEVTKSFRKTDLDGFETMSDEDKGAFVELHKKEV